MNALYTIFLCISLALAGQAQTLSQLPAVKTIPVVGEYSAGAYSIPIKADRDGNVYVHLVDRMGASSSSRGILKISPDGTRVTHFDTGAAAQGMRLMDFTPTPWGDVYVLYRSGRPVGNVVARFSSDGQLLYSNKTAALPFATRIAAVSGGSLVLVSYVSHNGQRPIVSAVLIGDTGTLLSRVSFENAARVNGAQDSPRTASEPAGPSFEPVHVVTSSDGDAYVAVNDPYPIVFRISSSGQARRYDLPRPQGQIRIGDTLVGDGRMLLSYSLVQNTEKPNSLKVTGQVYELIDLNSGKTLKLFAPPTIARLVALNANTLLYFRSAKGSDPSKLKLELGEARIE